MVQIRLASLLEARLGLDLLLVLVPARLLVLAWVSALVQELVIDLQSQAMAQAPLAARAAPVSPVGAPSCRAPSLAACLSRPDFRVPLLRGLWRQLRAAGPPQGFLTGLRLGEVDPLGQRPAVAVQRVLGQSACPAAGAAQAQSAAQ